MLGLQSLCFTCVLAETGRLGIPTSCGSLGGIEVPFAQEVRGEVYRPEDYFRRAINSHKHTFFFSDVHVGFSMGFRPPC